VSYGDYGSSNNHNSTTSQETDADKTDAEKTVDGTEADKPTTDKQVSDESNMNKDTPAEVLDQKKAVQVEEYKQRMRFRQKTRIG
jgi:hypothetical protein